MNNSTFASWIFIFQFRKSYFHVEKIYFHVEKIYFHVVKIYFHVVKIVFYLLIEKNIQTAASFSHGIED